MCGKRCTDKWCLKFDPDFVISARRAGRQAIKVMKQETSNVQFFDMDDELR